MNVISDQLIQALLAQAAPVLMGQKPAALFTLSEQEARELRAAAEKKDGLLRVKTMRRCGKRVQILLYHVTLLEQALQCPRVRRLLTRTGYPEGGSLSDLLKHLHARICTCEEFPHEVGLFLGYPVKDVLGFMVYGGAHCKMCGTWKVYSDVDLARARFASYHDCTQCLEQFVVNGGNLMELCFTQHKEQAQVG